MMLKLQMNVIINMEKQQTAVEWLYQQLNDTPKDKLTWQVILDKAKEMEKEQIIDAYKYGNQSDIYFKPEQYYNETYK
jgi:hypothetical protein